MPQAEIRVFRDESGKSPLLAWLDMLRRPHADYLRDGIRELRMKVGRVNYRILYSFVGSQVAVLTHGLKKEAAVPAAEIEFAISCLALVRSDPQKYTAEFEV